MTISIETIALALFAYLVGSVPTGIVVAKLFGGPNPQTVGSGNMGATNVLRTTGKAAGILTLTFEVLKGAAAVIAALIISPDTLTISLTGFAVFAGHLFPIFLKFKGGKGVATAAGVLLVISPIATALCIAVLIVTVLITNYVSLGSIVAAAVLPIFMWIIPEYRDFTGLGITIAVLVIVKHKSNIKKLLHGEETKFRNKKPQS